MTLKLSPEKVEYLYTGTPCISVIEVLFDNVIILHFTKFFMWGAILASTWVTPLALLRLKLPTITWITDFSKKQGLMLQSIIRPERLIQSSPLKLIYDELIRLNTEL